MTVYVASDSLIAKVIITVRDVNDNEPVFEKRVFRNPLLNNTYFGAIDVKSDPFTRVLTVQVSTKYRISLLEALN